MFKIGVKYKLNEIIFIIPVANRTTRAVSLRSERSLSRGFPSLDLDTVLEERSDQEQTQVNSFTLQSFLFVLQMHYFFIFFHAIPSQTDLMTPESPSDPQYRGCESSSS